MKNMKCSESQVISEVMAAFSEEIGGVTPDYHIKSRPDGDYVVIELARPTERFYALLESINEKLPMSHLMRDRLTIDQRKKKPSNTVDLPETQLLQRELSQSLTVDRNTFGDDFLSRYTPSVTNYEKSIIGKANFIVYGRRGSGKSSLMAYAMHTLKGRKQPYCWVAMQTYSGREDLNVVPSVLGEIFREAARYAKSSSEFERLHLVLQEFGEADDDGFYKKLEKMVPRLRNVLGSIATSSSYMTIFLDDLHVLGQNVQPELLAFLYSICRDNNICIKVSGIEQFTRTWNGAGQRGLQSPHDAQILNLDYNLTMPDRSLEHVRGILDAHARYCGLPAISYVADDSVLSRLVLVAAAVPRDALSLFAQAIMKSSIKAQKSVTVTSVNGAASETVEEKLRDIERDIFEGKEEVTGMLERVKDFCIKKQRKNAFLVKIDNSDPSYLLIQKLVSLRLIHVLHEGITPHKAGERYVALMLDYGFYVGVRAARSVELFPDKPKILLAKDLRKLPIFE